MAKTTRNYWAYRIDKSNSKFLNQELQAGRLRQGWGYDKGQDSLRRSVQAEETERVCGRRSEWKRPDVHVVPSYRT